MSVHECLVGAAGTAAPPERTPIKNLPRISQMCTDQEGMASCHTHATLCQSSHRIHRSFWLRIFSHGFHRCPQKFLAQDILPRISQMLTDG